VKLPLDSLAPPALDDALVLGEALSEADIVEEPGGRELAHRVLDRLGPDPLALEPGAQLGHRSVASRDRPVGDLERALCLAARADRVDAHARRAA